MWNLANAPVWSDLIHVAIWRNDGFLCSFCNFSKSSTFGENFMRIKFILHKIFFRTSILSSRKTSQMFFDLYWKNCEKPFVGVHDLFERKRSWATKININFFVKNEVSNIFHITIFSKKITIFSKITAKNNFCRAWHFSRNWLSDNKNDITFSIGNGVPNTALQFFYQKPLYPLIESQKTSFGGTFSPISVILLDCLFPKKKKKKKKRVRQV